MDGQYGNNAGADNYNVSLCIIIVHFTLKTYCVQNIITVLSLMYYRPTLESSQLDYRPSSLVQIEEREIHAFFNYFLNYQLGHTVGMPATLLSPVAFEGGVLRSLKVTRSLHHKFVIFYVYSINKERLGNTRARKNIRRHII